MNPHDETYSVESNDPVVYKEQQDLVSPKAKLMKNYVILGNSYTWKTNEKFSRMVESQLSKFPELPIDQLAISIVRCWTTNMNGGFVQENPSKRGSLEDISEIEVISKIHRMMQLIKNESNQYLSDIRKATLDNLKLNETEFPGDLMAESNFSQLDDPLHPNDFQADPSILLPITKEIFDQPLSPFNSPCKNTRASLTTVNQPHKPNTTSSYSNRIKSLPPRKRFRLTSAKTSITSKSDSTASEQKSQNIRRKLNDSLLISSGKEITNLLQNDIVFDDIEGFSSTMRGNLAFKHWLPRLINPRNNVELQASQVLELFSLLSCRFIKSAVTKDTQILVEMQREDAITTIAAMIKKLLEKDHMRCQRQQSNEQGETSTCTQRTLCVDVPVLCIDVQNGLLQRNTKVLTVERRECPHEPLWAHDLIFDEQRTENGNHGLSFGNLFFLHHADAFMKKFERCVSMKKKLSLVMEILTSWEEDGCGKARYFAPIEGRLGNEFRILSDGDKISIYIAVIKMISNDLLPPFPRNKKAGILPLTRYWTINRAWRWNNVYQESVETNLDEFAIAAKITNDHQRTLSEKLIASRIVGSTHSIFMIFDNKEKRWKHVDHNEAVNWTLACLRLKTFFSGRPISDFTYKEDLASSERVSDIAGQSQDANLSSVVPEQTPGDDINRQKHIAKSHLSPTQAANQQKGSIAQVDSLVQNITPLTNKFSLKGVGANLTPPTLGSVSYATAGEIKTPTSSSINPWLESRLLLLQSPSPNLFTAAAQGILNSATDAGELPSFPQEVDCESQSLSLQQRYSFESCQEFQERIKKNKVDSNSLLHLETWLEGEIKLPICQKNNSTTL